MNTYRERLERQLQALKGLLMTLPTLRDEYARGMKTGREQLGAPAALAQMQNGLRAQVEISDVLAHIGHFSSCLATSVVAHSVVMAFESIVSERNDALDQALAPLRHIVQTKVWSPNERRDLFSRCFRILNSAESKFAHLIHEVKKAFPEETAELERETTSS